MKKLFLLILFLLVPSIGLSSDIYYISIGNFGIMSGQQAYNQLYEFKNDDYNMYFINRTQLYLIAGGQDKLSSGHIISRNNIPIQSNDKEIFNKIIDLSNKIFLKEHHFSKNDFICQKWFFTIGDAYSIIKITENDVYAFDYYKNIDTDAIESTFSFDEEDKNMIKQINDWIKELNSKVDFGPIDNSKALDATKIFSRVLYKYENTYILNKTFIDLAYINIMINSIMGKTPPDLYLNKELFPFVYEFSLYPNQKNKSQYLYYFYDNNPAVFPYSINKTILSLIESYDNGQNIKQYTTALKFMYLYGDDFKRKILLHELQGCNEHIKNNFDYKELQYFISSFENDKSYCNDPGFLYDFFSTPIKLQLGEMDTP